jgi:hypothetical protein
VEVHDHSITITAAPSDSLPWNMAECSHSHSGGTHIVTVVAQVGGSFSNGNQWEIAETTTNSPPPSKSPTIVASGVFPVIRDTLAPYYTDGTPTARYFWGRVTTNSGTGPWTPDAINHPGYISHCGWF